MSRPSDPVADTLAYYDRHATEFCGRTRDVDMTDLYAPFLARIPQGGRILDVGCGSGRDSAAFLRRGYDVVSMDGSQAMVVATTALTGRAALHLRFDEISFRDEFDGIWACASLLHVVRHELLDVFQRLATALRAGGVLYVSFKRGTGDVVRESRHFVDMDEGALRELVSHVPEFREIHLWVTDDVRGAEHPRWLNALFTRT
jgi:SAM-dependent methyltransferase